MIPKSTHLSLGTLPVHFRIKANLNLLEGGWEINLILPLYFSFYGQ